MNLTSPSQVKAWCIENGFHPNRTLGQNFLIDRNILEAILDAAGVAAGQRVLEVGPGLGVLTEALLERGARVTAVEKDARLAARLTDPGMRGIARGVCDLIRRGEVAVGTRLPPVRELALALGVLQHGVQGLCGGHAPEGADHVGIGRAGVAELAAVGLGNEDQGLVEGMGSAHVMSPVARG